MVHYIFWLFSGCAPPIQPAKGGWAKSPSHPAATRRSSWGVSITEALRSSFFLVYYLGLLR